MGSFMIKPINLFKTIETHQSGIKGLGVKRIGIFGSYARRQEKNTAMWMF